MPRENVAQWNFTSGEVSPNIAGRVDTKIYANGLRKCENFIIRPQGGASRRLGSRHVKTSWTADKTSLLVPFVFSDVQAYLLQFGDGFIHFYKNGEPLLETTTEEVERFALSNNGGLFQVRTQNFTDLPGWGTAADNGTLTISNASGRVRLTTSIPHTLRTGANVFISSSELASINNNSFVVTRVSAYAVDLQDSVWGSGPQHSGPSFSTEMWTAGLLAGDRVYISGADEYPTLSEKYHTVKEVISWENWIIANVDYESHGNPTGEEAWTIPIEVITGYEASELAELRFAQSADILYIMHPDHPTMKLTRLDNDGDRNDWLLSQVDFVDGPYLPLNDNAPNVDTTTPANGSRYLDVYLEVSGYAHTATVTSATPWIAGDQGKYLEYRQGDQWRLAHLDSGAIGATTGTVTILDNVLLYLDEATRFKNTPKHGSAPSGSSANSAWMPVYGTRRDGSVGIVRYQKIDPHNNIVSNQTGATAGVLTSAFANTFGVSDVCKYVRYTDTPATSTAGAVHWAKIIKIAATGASATHEAPVSMVANNATGNFIITNEARTGTIKSYRAGAVFALFTASDVGRHIRLSWGGKWTWGKILTVVSSHEVTVQFYADVPRDPHDSCKLAGAMDGTATVASTTGRTYTWRLGAWSESTGYPSTACFHEQRLLFGRTDTQPATLWGSVTGDFENMTPTELDGTVLDDSAIDFTLASGKVNAIKWMESGTSLVIGTNGGEWLARSTSVTQEPITPTNISVIQQSRNGSSRIAQPMRIGSEIAFVDRSEQNLMAVSYLFSEDRLEDKDLTVVSEHIIRQGGSVVQTAFQQNPNGIAWLLLDNGTLAAMTYNPDQEIIGWHRHFLSGTDAFIESICVIPSEDGTFDELYALVKRTINGNTVRYIEVIAPDFYPIYSNARLTEDGDPRETEGGDPVIVEDAVIGSGVSDNYVDCSRKVIGFGGTAITGLHYLEGEDIKVLGDGYLIVPVSFASGVLTLTQAYDEVVVGLAYTSILKSLPPEGGSTHGVSQGMKKKMPEMKVRVADSFGMRYGWESSLVAKDFTRLQESETSLPYFSGTVPLTPKIPYREDVPWTISYAQPYPLNVLAVVSVLETAQ